MNYTTLIELLSACGVGCVLINRDNTIIAINDLADTLLEGHGQMPGQKLPESLSAVVEKMRNNPTSDKTNPAESSADPGSGEPAGLFNHLLIPENSPGTYVRISFGRYVSCQTLLDHPLLPGDTKLLIIRDASRDHALDMTVSALDRVHEAVVICDEEDLMYFCNTAALEIDDLTLEKVCGQPVDDVYENEDASPLSIPTARISRVPSLDHRQFYHTKNGQSREIIANFFPVVRGDDVLGAFSVVEDWDTASSLQRKVIDLQDRLLQYSRGEESGDHFSAGSSALTEKTEVPADSESAILNARYRFEDLVAQSAVMRNTVKLCREAAIKDHPVLLYGETGTGRHFLAEGIHSASRRSGGPFLHFNCTSLPPALLEAMLFGTVQGAYPEAEDRKGLLEQASGGTLFLAEIDAMPLPLQNRFLHVLQRGVFSRIGDDHDELQLNARFLFSSSRSPERAVEAKKLSPSLYSFLQHWCIMVPPLRNRGTDIVPLTMEFVNSCNRRYHKQIVTVSDTVLSLFRKYRWPGNVRELKQTVSRAVRAVPDGVELLTTEYLPSRIPQRDQTSALSSLPGINPAPGTNAVVMNPPADNDALKDTVTQLRRQSIYQILVKNGGNITRTAAEMGLSRQNLQYHIRQCGIDLEEIRAAARKK